MEKQELLRDASFMQYIAKCKPGVIDPGQWVVGNEVTPFRTGVLKSMKLFTSALDITVGSAYNYLDLGTRKFTILGLAP